MGCSRTSSPSSRWPAKSWTTTTFRVQVAGRASHLPPEWRRRRSSIYRRFAARLYFVCGELNDPATYDTLRERLAEIDARLPSGSGRLFYLAIPPSLYTDTINRLAESGIAPRVTDPKQRPWVRIIIEKPFGRESGERAAR